MRLSTVGRIILAEVCIIFNNCSVTESNDSLTISEKEETWRIAKLFYFILFYFYFYFFYFEGGEKSKNISMDFFSCQSYTLRCLGLV